MRRRWSAKAAHPVSCVLQEPQLRRLFPAGWIIAVRCFTGCRTLYCANRSLCRMPLHDWSFAGITRTPLATHPRARQGSPVAVRAGASLLGRRLPSRARQHSALSTVSWRFDSRGAANSAVMATELLQPRNTACGTLFQSSCVILTSPTDCSDDSWRDTFFGKHEHGALWLLICGAVEKHLHTYLHVNAIELCHSTESTKYDRPTCSAGGSHLGR